ncbi:MAG: hypothetical protein GY926_04855 [bacterium]|nr:hypothetical protein [bacterium]
MSVHAKTMLRGPRRWVWALVLAGVVGACGSTSDGATMSSQTTSTSVLATGSGALLAPAPPEPADSPHFALAADWVSLELTVSWAEPETPRGVCGSIFWWNQTRSSWWSPGPEGQSWWHVVTSLGSSGPATLFVDPAVDEEFGCVDVEVAGEPDPDVVTLTEEMLAYEALIYCHGKEFGCETIPGP